MPSPSLPFPLCSDINGGVKVWSLSSHRPVFERQLHDAMAGVMGLQRLSVNGVACDAQGDMLLSAGRDGVVKVCAPWWVYARVQVWPGVWSGQGVCSLV